jgi:hypothetical protein
VGFRVEELPYFNEENFEAEEDAFQHLPHSREPPSKICGGADMGVAPENPGCL